MDRETLPWLSVPLNRRLQSRAPPSPPIRHPSPALSPRPIRQPVPIIQILASDETRGDATRRDVRHGRKSGNAKHVAARMKKAAICSHASLTDDWSVAGANRLSDVGAYENGNGASCHSDFYIFDQLYNWIIIIFVKLFMTLQWLL